MHEAVRGLPPSAKHILDILEQREGLTRQDLITSVDVTPRTVDRAIDHLQEQDLVSMSRASHDRREKRISIVDPTDDLAAWTPDVSAGTPTCSRCNSTVSHAFHRMWADNDGILRGCRECLPRSVRFGEDVYGRSKDDFGDFDPDDANKGRDPGGIRQQPHSEDEDF